MRVRFLKENPDAEEYKAIIYGSLAKTGAGHMTDEALEKVFEGKRLSLVFNYDTPTEYHTNTMDFIAIKDGKNADVTRYYSMGGEVISDGKEISERSEVY